MNFVKEIEAEALRAAFTLARSQGQRAREAAESLGLSEGAALAAHVGEHQHALKVRALRGPWLALLQALGPCGALMALTRNDSTVHEKTGVYQNLSGNGPVGLALGEEIDLRLFFDNWHAGFAVTETASNPATTAISSLQFFDAQGRAVHKIFTRAGSQLAAWAGVVSTFADPAMTYGFQAPPPAAPSQADALIDVAAFTAEWARMSDTHQFFGLLRRHGVARQQGLRLVEGRFSQRLGPHAVRALLYNAAFDGTPIMVFVGSAGCIQIHTGPVKRVEPMTTPRREGQGGPVQWLNILDPGFNLHLREDLIGHVWRVEKPTADGLVTSVEAFDLNGNLMAMFFGARKPGQAELSAWRALLQDLPLLETSTT